MEMLFTRGGYEQSSSELIAGHRAARFGDIAASPTCAAGSAATSSRSPPGGRSWPSTGTRRTPGSPCTTLASTGWPTGCGPASVTCATSGSPGSSAVFVDPARRDGTRRFPAGVSEPSLDWCFALAERVPAVCVKAAPGLPAELIPAGWEAEFIADGRDLKEAVLWSPACATAPRRATILPGGDTLVAVPGGAGAGRRARGVPARSQPRRHPGRAGGGPGARHRRVAARSADRLSLGEAGGSDAVRADPARASTPPRGTRSGSPGGCANSASAPPTCGAAASRVTWTRSGGG